MIYSSTTSGSVTGIPVKSRGLYFNKASANQGPAFLSFRNFMFGATFSIHSWILRKSTDTDVTILNKYHGHLDNHRSEAFTHLEITILANGKISTSVDQVEDNSIYKSV